MNIGVVSVGNKVSYKAMNSSHQLTSFFKVDYEDEEEQA